MLYTEAISWSTSLSLLIFIGDTRIISFFDSPPLEQHSVLKRQGSTEPVNTMSPRLRTPAAKYTKSSLRVHMLGRGRMRT